MNSQSYLRLRHLVEIQLQQPDNRRLIVNAAWQRMCEKHNESGCDCEACVALAKYVRAKRSFQLFKRDVTSDNHSTEYYHYWNQVDIKSTWIMKENITRGLRNQHRALRIVK